MTWIAVAICVLVSLMFSGIEAGILSINRVRLRHRRKLNDPAANKLSALLAKPERLLVTVLLVTNFMNICAILLTTRELVSAWGKIGYLCALILWLPVTLLGLEFLPKSLFRRFPYRALAPLAEVLRVTDILLSPVLALGAMVVRLIPRKLASDEEKKLFIAREDFKYLTIESERQGALSKVEREMIHSVVDFRAVTAKDVMMPMENVRALRSDARVSDVLKLCRETNLERLPVLSPKDEVVGLVNVFDILFDPSQRDAISSYTRRIVTVTPDEEAFHVIQKLRAARVTVAAVVPARTAKPLGIVSAEDLIARLVKMAAT